METRLEAIGRMAAASRMARATSQLFLTAARRSTSAISMLQSTRYLCLERLATSFSISNLE
jgi:hypothetical protein